MKTIKLLLLLLSVATTLYSQADFPAFGSFSEEEKKLKQCSFDPEAEAIILLDKEVITHDDDYKMITERRVRIKILSQKGISRADIVIPYYSKDDFEYISKIEGYTYNFSETGESTVIPVDKKSFYSEKLNSLYSLEKFAMPAVKVGSIIEYHYTSIMKSYHLDDWEFQSDLPTINSNLLLEVLPRAEFAYSVQKERNLNISIKPLPSEGRVYFEMNNIPGLRDEPFMDARGDYLQKVTFQLSGYTNVFGSKQEIKSTWQSAAIELMNDRDFGSQLDKDFKIDELKPIIQSDKTQFEKLSAIYYFVKRNISWNGFRSRYADDGLKAVWDKKKGTNSEINLLLINFLKAAGIETYPLLVAERDFGKPDTTYPFIDKFNKVVAFAIADGKQFLLDATQDNCPPGLTPYPILGTTAFLVDKKKYNLIKIVSGNKRYKNQVSITATIDAKGMITGEAITKSFDYARQQRLNAMQRDKKKFIGNYFENNNDGISIDDFSGTMPEADSIPFVQTIKYKGQLNESGGFIFFNPNLFTGEEKNPFISSIRFTNVNFGYPYDIFVEESIKLPAGAKIDLPENKFMISDDNLIQASKQVAFENGELKIFIHFIQSTTLVKAENYAALKEFYRKMIDMLNEPIPIKLAN